LFLKFPINSFFLVSTLMIGHPEALKADLCVAMYRNCSSRSGQFCLLCPYFRSLAFSE
jgi:hypothetical protein